MTQHGFEAIKETVGVICESKVSQYNASAYVSECYLKILTPRCYL